MTTFDSDLALKNYLERKDENRGKQRDNGSMPAGSPMYYYCRHCLVHTETLPELHIRAPRVVCNACKVLADHGCLPLSAAKEAALRPKVAGSPEDPLEASWATLKGQ
mgnify:CR=1 FL=1